MRTLRKSSIIICLAFAGVYLSCAHPFASCPHDIFSKKFLNNSTFEFEQILKTGGNVDARDRNGNTALIKSINSGNHVVAQILLEHGADINQRGRTTETPLIIAARKGDVEMTKKLLSFGADVDVRDKNYQTALIVATISSQPEIVGLLLNSGADHNLRDNSGRTAITIAAQNSDEKLMEILSRDRKDSLSSIPVEDLQLLGSDMLK